MKTIKTKLSLIMKAESSSVALFRIDKMEKKEIMKIMIRVSA